jgi:hypothetical protein
MTEMSSSALASTNDATSVPELLNPLPQKKSNPDLISFNANQPAFGNGEADESQLSELEYESRPTFERVSEHDAAGSSGG